MGLLGRTVFYTLPLIGGIGFPTLVVVGVVAGAVAGIYHVGKWRGKRSAAAPPSSVRV